MVLVVSMTPVMYSDISGESPVNILELIGYEFPIIWQIGKPYSNQVFIRKGDYGNGGTGRLLYIDFSGPTLSYNQFTAFDLEIGVLSFEQDYHGVDFGIDFLSVSANAGVGTELIGYEFGASVFSIPIQGEIPLPGDEYYFIIAVEFKMFSVSSCYKYENGKVELGSSAIFGIHFIFGFEERN